MPAFNSLQSVFRQRLLGPRMTYAQRMKSFADAPRPTKSKVLHLDEPSLVFDTFVQAAMDTLIRLREDVDRSELQGFVDVLAKSGAVHIIGARGAYGGRDLLLLQPVTRRQTGASDRQCRLNARAAARSRRR